MVEAVQIEQLIMIIIGIVGPMIAGGGAMKYRDNRKMGIQKDEMNKRMLELGMTKYKYEQLICFARSVSDCLEDEKITPAETKILSRQLKRLLEEGVNLNRPVEVNRIQQGGFVV